MESSCRWILMFLCITGLASYATGGSPSRYTHHWRIRFGWPEERPSTLAVDDGPRDLAGALGQRNHLGEIWRLVRDVEIGEALRGRQSQGDEGSDGQGQKETSSEDDDKDDSDKEEILPKTKRIWELTGMDVVSQIIRGIEKQQRQQEMMRKG
ncbi:hypothetical protein Btru_075423 [Bulinus truncatus]|nr:hypothetical protein Btru_075423 [Bulinus truncatus]